MLLKLKHSLSNFVKFAEIDQFQSWVQVYILNIIGMLCQNGNYLHIGQTNLDWKIGLYYFISNQNQLIAKLRLNVQINPIECLFEIEILVHESDEKLDFQVCEKWFSSFEILLDWIFICMVNHFIWLYSIEVITNFK